MRNDTGSIANIFRLSHMKVESTMIKQIFLVLILLCLSISAHADIQERYFQVSVDPFMEIVCAGPLLDSI